MTSVASTHVVSFPPTSPLADRFAEFVAGTRGRPLPEAATAQTIERLRARCDAAEHAAAAAAAAEARLREEVLRTREVCQQMLEVQALEVLELRRALQARDRVAAQGADTCHAPAAPSSPARASDDEIPFEMFDAVLAASPL